MKRYHVVIRSEFVTDPGLTLGVGVLPSNGLPGELLVIAHTDHPLQANDDAAGVAVAIEVARRLVARPMPEPHMGVRFLFCPETIGSICYLSQHPGVTQNLRAGIFIEMAGTSGPLTLQHSYPGGNRIDLITQSVMRRLYGPAPRELGFRKGAGNDEMVLNGPGVSVPCISLQRWPYPEYHTSDDTAEIIDPRQLDEVVAVATTIIKTFCTDYAPVRRFTGPVFLSGYGLFREDGPLSIYDTELLMLLLGDKTIWEIAGELGRDYWAVRAFCEEMRAKGLIAIGEG